MKAIIANSVEDYITQFPNAVQKILKTVRQTVKSAAPDAVESIAYGIPAYKYNGKPVGTLPPSPITSAFTLLHMPTNNSLNAWQSTSKVKDRSNSQSISQCLSI